MADELIRTAKYVATPGKGILAADESTSTIGKRLQSINVENTESNRQALREMLFTAPGTHQYLSGVLMFEETLFQKTIAGKPFVKLLEEGGVLTGIKVDTGTVELAGTNGETTTQGHDGLAGRCKKYYDAGQCCSVMCCVFNLFLPTYKKGARKPRGQCGLEGHYQLRISNTSYAALCCHQHT